MQLEHSISTLYWNWQYTQKIFWGEWGFEFEALHLLGKQYTIWATLAAQCILKLFPWSLIFQDIRT
jgi:hypothetical protein